MPSLARSVPKPLKVPSLARSCEMDKLGSCPNDFKNLTITVTFFKNGLQLVGPRGYF